MDHGASYHVFEIPNKPLWLLWNAATGWTLEHQEQQHPLKDSNHAVPLLPLLERPYEEVVALIRTGLATAGVDEAVASTFPFELILCCALTWYSDYWPTCALQWIEEGYTPGEEARVALTNLVANRGYSQPLRHRAGRLIRRLQSVH